MFDEQALHHLVPASGPGQRFPLRDLLMPVQRRQAIELRVKRSDVAFEMRIFVAQQSNAGIQWQLESDALGRPH